MIIFMFHVATALFGGCVTVLLVLKLLLFPDQFKLVERIGMGIVAGTMVLRIGPVMAAPEVTPFSDWSTCLMSLGLVLMHWGRLARLIRHNRQNTLAADAARAHHEARRRLGE